MSEPCPEDVRTALADAIVTADRAGSAVDRAAVAAASELSLEQGHAVQLEVLMRHLAAGDSPAGWKVGMTSGDNRDKMGPGVRPFGFVRGSRRFGSGAHVALADIPDAGIEPELGFLVGRSVGGIDLTCDDILGAVAGVVPCFEINQQRLPSVATDPVKVAADLSQWGVVAGQPVSWRGSVADLVVSLARDGEQVASSGPDFAIDDPVESVRALCARLATYGLALLPGQVVITGAFSKARVDAPSRWSASFSGMGDVEVELG